jgi:3',5'-cyclic AMP phosphodiesterase CpdA
VLALDGVATSRFLNKRFTGWVNLKVKRGHAHRPSYVRAIAQEVTRAKVDHVVITGDLTNLALEQEFRAVRELLEQELGMGTDDVSIVPGNHDLSTRGALRARRFSSFFEPPRSSRRSRASSRTTTSSGARRSSPSITPSTTRARW